MTAHPSFDLTLEPWIPCETLDGQRIELGIQDTLTRAHELRGVVDSSPLVTAALHRLLLAVLHRCFGPANQKAWIALWTAKHFDASAIKAYLDQWRHRFNLFDESRPFYQCPGLTFEPKEATLLVTERSNYGNPVDLFEHRPVGQFQDLSPAAGARLVVALQSFALGGTITGDRKGGDPTSAKDAPVARGAMVLIGGDTAFETLMLNLLVYQPQAGLPIAAIQTDAPAWEQPEPARIDERAPFGWLDLLTWQSRRLLLYLEVNGHVVVRQATIAGGVDLDREKVQDPMLAWKAIEKRGWQSVAFNPERVVWRDSTALLRPVSKDSQPAKATDQLAPLIRQGIVLRERQYAIHLFGLAPEKAKVLLTRHEHFPLPLKLLSDPALVESLEEALHQAEAAYRALDGAVRRLAECALSPGYDPRNKQSRRPRGEDVSSLVRSMGISAAYWVKLRVPFETLLVKLGGDETAARAQFTQTLRNTALAMFAQASQALGTSAPVLKGAAYAEQHLRIQLAPLKPPQEQGVSE